MTPGLSVEHLGARLAGRPVLRDIHLPDLQPGCLTALIGPNAAGKSTLLRVIAGLVPASGAVRLGETDLLGAKASVRARHVAFLPQMSSGTVDLTTLDALLAAVAASGDRPRAAVERSALQTLDRMGLLDLAAVPLSRLSGGQRQMVGIAQAVVRDPPVLLLDEPTSALDLRHQERIMALLSDLAGEGRIVIAVLHDLNLAARWADRVVALGRGRIVGDGAPSATLTPDLLAALYGVSATVTLDAEGRPSIRVTGLSAIATGNGRPRSEAAPNGVRS